MWFLLWLWPLWLCRVQAGAFTPDHLQALRQQTRSMFDHAWGAYMRHGFPMDEVRPITCEPYGPDFKNKNDVIRNDVLGNVSLTMLDNLDTLVIFERWDDLEFALSYLKSQKDTFFHKDVIVQVFEMTIRSLGGLLSTHLMLSELVVESPRFQQISSHYDGFLLEMAHDLGTRLIPAFKTSNNIPVPRINLMRGVKGVPYKLQLETCTSGATTPVLEMTLLTKLTGDTQFENYAKKTFWKLWNSRSALDLMPMSIDPIKNEWKDSIAGIGASIDSFYEYSLKGSILFNDEDMWTVFKTSYKALMTHLAKGFIDRFSSLVFANVNSEDGLDATIWIDLLSAFWPGVQVLAGQLKHAIGTHMVFLKIWDHFDLIPERWNCLLPREKLKDNVIGLEWYPLRPEFIESTYYLYRATADPLYLQIGERILNLFQEKFYTTCGFKGLQDIRTGQFQNRMESFVLSETLKYLYLLFDESNDVFLHQKPMAAKNWIFSTEGHPLWYSGSSGPRAPSHHRASNSVFSGSSTSSSSAVNELDRRLGQCEVSPFTATGFLKSSYYELPNLFNLDYQYRDYLKKPAYLPQTNLDGSYIELTDDFYSTFTMFPANLTCPVQSTTTKLDLFLGNRTNIKDQTLTRIPGTADYWLPAFEDLRMTIEVLQKGEIDSSYNEVTEEHLAKYNRGASARVLKINGVFIERHETVFVEGGGLQAMDRHVLINDIPVENLQVWQDSSDEGWRE